MRGLWLARTRPSQPQVCSVYLEFERKIGLLEGGSDSPALGQRVRVSRGSQCSYEYFEYSYEKLRIFLRTLRIWMLIHIMKSYFCGYNTACMCRELV